MYYWKVALYIYTILFMLISTDVLFLWVLPTYLENSNPEGDNPFYILVSKVLDGLELSCIESGRGPQEITSLRQCRKLSERKAYRMGFSPLLK